MKKSSLSQIMLASAAILLSAAYILSLHHEASQEKANNYSSLVTILFVPAILSAISFWVHRVSSKKYFLNIAVFFTVIYLIISTLYLYFSYRLVHDAGFKLNTSFDGLLNALPLGYLILLAVGSLIMKKRNRL